MPVNCNAPEPFPIKMVDYYLKVFKLLPMKKDIGQLYSPKQQLSLIDAIAIIVGIVIGAGIFRTPSLVAANTTNDTAFLLAWVLRSEEHTSELQSLMRISYAVFC